MIYQELGQSFYPELPRKELITRVNNVLAQYGEKSIPVLREMVRSGQGRQVIGDVGGDPTHQQLVIDSIGEHILTNLVREYNIPCIVKGEHNPYIFSENPQVYFSQDSFDNTRQYYQGLDTPPYTVVGSYFSSGEPMATIVCDIKNRLVYFNVGKETFIKDLETGVIKKTSRSQRTSIKDDNFCFATYLGSNEYSSKSLYGIDKNNPDKKFPDFRRLIMEASPKGVLYAGGGAFIGGPFSEGAADVYAMYDEPYSEIFPPLALLLAAGCTVNSVDLESGKCEEIKKFDLSKYSETVPFYIVANNAEIRDAVIKIVLEEKDKLKIQEEENRLFGEYKINRGKFLLWKATRKSY